LLLQILGVAVLVGALFVIPIGLPGVWIMVAVLLVGTLAGWVSWPVWAGLAVLAAVAEALEFWVLKHMGDRYGGTRGSFWGAVAGGFVGVLVGAPVPVVGSLVAGMIGTFVGAGIVTLYGTRSTRVASRVAWGMLLARTFAVGRKVAVGVAVLVVGAAALLVR
jgi:uncharacterized protein YqgC (DUF456 family)